MTGLRSLALATALVCALSLAACAPGGQTTEAANRPEPPDPLALELNLINFWLNEGLELAAMGSDNGDAPGLAAVPGDALTLPKLRKQPKQTGLKVDQLTWQCEGTFPASQNPAIGTFGCVSYIAGFLDAVGLAEYLTGKRIFCPPDGRVSESKAVGMFLEWAKANPETKDDSARAALTIVLRNAYPCPQ